MKVHAIYIVVILVALFVGAKYGKSIPVIGKMSG